MLEHVFPGAPDLSVTALAPPNAPCRGPQSYQAHLVLSTIKHTWPLRAMGSTLRAQVLSQLLVPKLIKVRDLCSCQLMALTRWPTEARAAQTKAREMPSEDYLSPTTEPPPEAPSG